MMRRCPDCRAPTRGFFLWGLPGWCCTECSDPPLAGGPSAWVGTLAFVGAAVVYERGRYLRTLLAWLRGEFGA